MTDRPVHELPDCPATDSVEPDAELTRLKLRSADVVAPRVEQLAALFPEAVRDGKVDLDALRAVLGDVVDDGPERFGQSWPGKRDAIRVAQTPSEGTLVPMPEESVDWGTTQNVIVEGENLEVLKLLQRSYHRSVRLIYIDPPYNTGKDFVYPDSFRDPLDEYLRYSGQLDDNGGRLRANSETGGRYHSAWLSMMWPRLHLARSLLRDDGIVVVSIDDTEAPRLRMLLDEIFGEENFVATVIWEKVYAPKNTARHFSGDHDYLVVYARDADAWRPNALPRTEEMERRYRNQDDDPRGPWKPGDLSARNFYSQGTYRIVCPGGRVIERPPSGRYWVVAEDEFRRLDADDRIWWGEDGNNIPAVKRFLAEVKEGSTPRTLWRYSEVGHTQDAKKQLLRLVQFESSDSVFETPKPVQLMQRLLQLTTSTDEPEIVLDFFAGSGTLGDAVLRLNALDGGQRRFILIQLPELLDDSTHGTIASLARARVRAVQEELEGDTASARRTAVGFRAYRLDAPGLVRREGSGTDHEGSWQLFSEPVNPTRGDEALLAEVLLARGFMLTAPVEWLEVAGARAASVEDGALVACFARELTVELFEALVALEPAQLIVLEAGFGGDDEVKVNALQHLKTVNAHRATATELLVV
ncbi:MAG TPA: site-specific DNA-methyltransferase [Conexibacter sp.]|nr:site-specific DNA-methyltransferase [Conexibacter sp.]